jgi:hypothetical protein
LRRGISAGISEIDQSVASLALPDGPRDAAPTRSSFRNTSHSLLLRRPTPLTQPRAEGLPPVTAILGDTPAGDDPAPVSAHAPSSRRMPCELLDAPENLPKEAPGQVTFGQLEDEVPSVSNEAPAGLEQLLLETREGPVLNGDGQDEPTQQIGEVVGDDSEQEADLVGSEPVTGEPGPVGGRFPP